MDSLAYVFRSGGSMMWAVLGADCTCCAACVPALVMALVFRRGSSRRAAQALAGVVALGAVTPIAFGGLGWQLGVATVEQALAVVDPQSAAELRAQGMAEAAIPLKFGVLSTLALVGAALVPVLLSLRPELPGGAAAPAGDQPGAVRRM